MWLKTMQGDVFFVQLIWLYIAIVGNHNTKAFSYHCLVALKPGGLLLFGCSPKK
jgi:hypothetical protein